MSCEEWASPPAQAVPCRLPSCGHIIQSAHLSLPGMLCTSCGNHGGLQQAPDNRDYVPTAGLIWEGASCTNSRRLPLLDLDIFVVRLVIYADCSDHLSHWNACNLDARSEC